jgi:hypothetical protein
MELQLKPISHGEFGIEPYLNERQLAFKLSGTGDMAAIGPLRKSLSGVQSEVARLGLKGFEVDIRGLYFLNSSCLKALVNFIYEVQTGPPTFPIRFVVTSRLSWQRRALAALERMAPELVTVEEGDHG